jgi:hypothetical protein
MQKNTSFTKIFRLKKCYFHYDMQKKIISKQLELKTYEGKASEIEITKKIKKQCKRMLKGNDRKVNQLE